MSQDEIAIKVEGVSKTFKLPHEKQTSIKGLFVNIFKGKRTYEKQHVLKDISFEIKKGEFFGVVGRNGSGKSTLLKLLAGIYSPDTGHIQVNGKLTPFIELGVGFNPELTGRENVFLNGALLGFNRKQMEAMYDEIVDFAELEKFMDQKLKNYSSGMQVRLAFSIAIRANTEILVLDEVLAVGDANFQKKCFDYFEKIKKEKKTIILVTHDMGLVERFCNRAALIHKGRIARIGKPSTVTKEYSDLNLQLAGKQAEKKKGKDQNNKDESDVRVEARVLKDDKETTIFDAIDPVLVLELKIYSKTDVTKPLLGIIINNSSGSPIFAMNTKAYKIDLPPLRKHATLTMRLEIDNIFANGEYVVSTGIRNREGTIIYYANESTTRFVMGGREHTYALASPSFKMTINRDD